MQKKDDVQKTQVISPGAMGEQVNREKNKVTGDNEKSINSTAQQEGLNEEKSSGSAGAYEGFENADL